MQLGHCLKDLNPRIDDKATSRQAQNTQRFLLRVREWRGGKVRYISPDDPSSILAEFFFILLLGSRSHLLLHGMHSDGVLKRAWILYWIYWS